MCHVLLYRLSEFVEFIPQCAVVFALLEDVDFNLGSVRGHWGLVFTS
jgi:hypothetical protein